MILADLPNSELGAWLYAAATVAQLAATITVLITINSKQRREITFAGEAVDKREFDRHVAENAVIHHQLFAKIGGAERGLEDRLGRRLEKMEQQSSEGREKMHERINDVIQSIGQLNISISSLETKLNERTHD